MRASLGLCLMCLPPDFGSLRAWIVYLPALRWGLGLPRQQCFPHQTTGFSRLFCIRLEIFRTFVADFAPGLPWALCRTSQPHDVEAFLLIVTPGLCRPDVPHTQPQPPTHPSPQICKGASMDERLQWHLPEEASFSWLPNPERTLEGRGSLA